jgi:hypothetical protein
MFYEDRFKPERLTGLYAEAIILKLCQAHGISHEEYANSLFRTLEVAAQWYRGRTRNEGSKLTAPEVKKYLTNMDRTLNTLAAQLNDMPEQVMDAFYGGVSFSR